MARDATFESFYRSGFDTVLRAARAFCGHRDVAYEATQEAFARAYARWGRLGKEDWARAWTTTTALNLCRDHYRRAGRPLPEVELHTRGPNERRVDMLAALRRLPERQREAVVLHYLVDCPVIVVAAAMNLSEGAVKAHLFKGRKALKVALEVHHAG